MSKKIYISQKPIGKEHQVNLDKEIFVTQRSTGFQRQVDLTKEIYNVDALSAFFLLTESGDFLQLEQGGKIVSYYG